MPAAIPKAMRMTIYIAGSRHAGLPGAGVGGADLSDVLSGKDTDPVTTTLRRRSSDRAAGGDCRGHGSFFSCLISLERPLALLFSYGATE